VNIVIEEKNMTRGLATIGLLVVSNTFMTFAWYGHLRFNEIKWFNKLGLFAVIAISWGIAFFEYCTQVPANRIGFNENGGPFSLIQLKVIQEVVSLIVFSILSTLLLKAGAVHWNHFAAFGCLVAAVYFVFLK
jgi:uncharacterized protein (DUF486 family)